MHRHIRKIASGAGIGFAGRAIGTGLKYVSQIALAWLLGAEALGLYALAITLYQFAELFAGIGLTSGTVRYVAMHHGAGDAARVKGVLLQSVAWPFAIGGLVGLGLVLGADAIASRIFGKPELAAALQIFAVALPFGASFNAAAFGTTGFQRAKPLIYLRELLQPFVNLAFLLALCLAGYGLVGAAAAWLVAAVVTFAETIRLVHRIFPAIFRRDVRPIVEVARLIRFSLPLALSDFLWLVLIWTDIVILGMLRPADEVGIYRAASQTALLVSLFYSSFYVIFGPALADLHRAGNIEGMARVFQAVTRWSLLLTLPVYLVVAVASADLLRIFGEEFVAGALPLTILGAGYLVVAGTGGVHYMLTMSGHPYLKLAGDIALAVTNVVLNLLFIPLWGPVGAAAATAISIAAVHLLRILQVYMLVGVQPYNRTYVRIALAGLLAGTAGIAVRQALDTYFLLSIVVVGTTILAVYLGPLIGMRLEGEDRMVLAKINGILKRPKSV